MDLLAVNQMTADEARRCVSDINSGLVTIRVRLLDLYEREGWKALGYLSWRDCATNEFDFSQTRVYELLAAAEVERDISDVSAIAETSTIHRFIPEGVLRPLADLEPEERRDVWKMAEASAPNGKITAAHVQAVKASYWAPEPTLSPSPDCEDQAEDPSENEDTYDWTTDDDNDDPLFCPGCMAWRDDSDVWVEETYNNQYEKYTSAKVVTCNQCGTTASYELAQGGQDCHSCKFYMPDTRADEFPFCLKLETRTSPDVMRCGGDKWVWENASTLQEQADLEERAAIDEVVTKPHVANNSGDNEWYTPAHIIESARSVMGGIDLDPASNDIANGVVRATTYYTVDDDGLSYQWAGRVWLNPPYSRESIAQFIEHLVHNRNLGHVTQAIVLVNNATETIWFRHLISVASSVVFPGGRVRFWKADGETSGPLQGQAIVYIGDRPQLFYEQFAALGWGAIL